MHQGCPDLLKSTSTNMGAVCSDEFIAPEMLLRYIDWVGRRRLSQNTLVMLGWPSLT